MSQTSQMDASGKTDMTTLSAELWRKKWRIAFVTLLLCMATYAVLSFFPKLYES